MLNAELEKITKTLIDNPEWVYPKNIAMAATNILAQMKGENLKVFDTSKSSSLCDFNILATAQNTIQARAMAQELNKQFRAQGHTIYSMEGWDQADWVLVDLGDIIVHIFIENTRDIYDLDRVFNLSQTVQIPDEFYFGARTPQTDNSEKLKGYF